MTGGTIYQRIQPEMNLTRDAIQRRIASGSAVELFSLTEHDIHEVRDLLHNYIQTLEVNNQAESVEHLYALLKRPNEHFIKIAPPQRVN
jgi:glutamate synthase (NADPH/NADH) large chain